MNAEDRKIVEGWLEGLHSDHRSLVTRFDSFQKEMRELQRFMDTEFSIMKTMVGHHALTCPYREEISSVSENRRNIERLTDRLGELEISVARSGAIGGVVGGSSAAVVTGVLYLIGRWLGMGW